MRRAMREGPSRRSVVVATVVVGTIAAWSASLPGVAAGDPTPTTTTVPGTTSTTPVPSTTTTTPSVTTTKPAATTTTTPTTTKPPRAGGPVAGPVTAQSAASSDAFVRGSDGALWWRQLTGTGWSAWHSFGGVVVGNPGAAGAPDASFVFVRGTDGALWIQRYDGVRWSGWQSLGGFITADPIAVADGSGVSVFVRGSDGGLWWRRGSAGNSWSGWMSAGGWIQGRAAAAADTSGTAAFVVGSDGTIFVQRFSASAGGGWVSLGGIATFDLAATTDTSGLAVYVRGTDGAVWRRRAIGADFGPWESLGGTTTSSPAVSSTGATTNLFVRWSDQSLSWRPIVNGVAQSWVPLSGVVASNIAASSDDSGTSVFVKGTDGFLWTRRYTSTWSGWQQFPALSVASDPYAMAASTINAVPPQPPGGPAFDTCSAPPVSTMAAWRLSSPYTTIGIYIGGINRGCPNTVLNDSAWVSAVEAQGWRLIPIYVGLQAPCYGGTSNVISTDTGTATAQGVSAANDAVTRAAAAGLKPGSPIYFDMEAYDNTNAACVNGVRAFVNGWVAQIHAGGYQAAMYSSLCSGIVDQAAVYSTPGFNRLDAIWVAAWAFADQNDPGYATYVPNLFGFTGCGTPLSYAMWANHQRLRQFRGAHDETWAGITLNIDSDVVDGPITP